ncbi:B-cell receptor-associated protein 31-like-domain-containing protein [Lipomyces arxii]|uniref:B-cell receptor-associated protein 31-like-domain-containing protein n=1 Tax=Lipomyces arxii TaxID=56418 RepID=UPI0034CF4A8D
MTLYYTLVFVILVTEMLAFFVLVTPLPFNLRRRMFTFISTSDIVARTSYTLKIIFVFILILFIDSVNRVFRVQQDYMTQSSGRSVVPTERSDLQARKFYAQRNMYLCGFTLFLSIILNRTFVLVESQLAAEDKISLAKPSPTSSTSGGEVKRLTAELSSRTSDLEIAQKELAESKSKLADLNKEFTDLSDRYNALQKPEVVESKKKT